MTTNVVLTITDHLNNLRELEKFLKDCGPSFDEKRRQIRRAIVAVEDMQSVIKKLRIITKRFS